MRPVVAARPPRKAGGPLQSEKLLPIDLAARTMVVLMGQAEPVVEF